MYNISYIILICFVIVIIFPRPGEDNGVGVDSNSDGVHVHNDDANDDDYNSDDGGGGSCDMVVIRVMVAGIILEMVVEVHVICKNCY